MPISMLKHLPKPARILWESAYNRLKKKYGVEKAAKLAWGIVKQKYKKNKKGVWVKIKGSSLEVSVKTLSTRFYVTKDENGNTVIEGILATVDVDKEGETYDEEALKHIAEQINKGEYWGDILHYSMNKALEFGIKSLNDIKNKSHKILKALKAIYKNGKLYIRAKVLKGYERLVRKFKSLSIETVYDTKDTYIDTKGIKHIKYANFLGFTLTNEPANPNAVLI